MYQVPTFLLPWIPLALCTWWDEGSSEWISSQPLYPLSPSLPVPSCNRDATAWCPSSHSQLFHWNAEPLHLFLCKVFQQHITNRRVNEQMTHVLVCFLWHTLVCKTLSQRTTVSLMNICSSEFWILPGPAWTKLGEVRWLCWGSGLFLILFFANFWDLDVFNLNFYFLIRKIRLPIFFLSTPFRKA